MRLIICPLSFNVTVAICRQQNQAGELFQTNPESQKCLFSWWARKLHLSDRHRVEKDKTDELHTQTCFWAVPATIGRSIASTSLSMSGSDLPVIFSLYLTNFHLSSPGFQRYFSVVLLMLQTTTAPAPLADVGFQYCSKAGEWLFGSKDSRQRQQ